MRAVCDPGEGKVAGPQGSVNRGTAPAGGLLRRGDRLPAAVRARRLGPRRKRHPRPLHPAVCMAVLAAGKHVATEAPAAVTVDECWQVVEAAEKSHRLC